MQRTVIERCAHQQDRVIARKVAEIIAKDPQLEATDLGIGAVDIDDVELAIGDGLVGQAMVDPAAGIDFQIVGFLETRPTVSPHQKFVRQPQAKVGGGRCRQLCQA